METFIDRMIDELAANRYTDGDYAGYGCCTIQGIEMYFMVWNIEAKSDELDYENATITIDEFYPVDLEGESYNPSEWEEAVAWYALTQTENGQLAIYTSNLYYK